MNKLRTAQVLMCITILLLITFQFYWIRKLYAEENNTFKTTADLNFRESIYKLQSQSLIQDSAILKGLPGFGENILMSQFLKDIAAAKGSEKGIVISITSSDNTLKKDKNDTLKDSLDHRMGSHFFINNKDTLAKQTIKKITFGNKTKDSIKIKSIDSLYTIQLKKTDHFVPFTIKKSSKTAPFNPTNNFHTQRVPVGLFHPEYYTAYFQNNTWIILKKIILPIIFAILLTGITLLSFIFLYRNLLAQQRLTNIKNEFIANITHELKTPISTVSVAIEAMKNFNVLDSPERTREYLDIAGLELNRLSLLVDKVLRLSMFESQQVDLKFQPFNIRDLAAEVVKSMQIQFDKFNAQVTLHTTGLDFNVIGDRMHITSVFYNLLDNALKYSDANPVIECHVDEYDQNTIIVKIKDKGVGIPLVYRNKVFEKFFRVPSGDQHNVKGYGLGLSYVAHIIDKHKGFIYIDDNSSKGSIISFHLPKHHD